MPKFKLGNTLRDTVTGVQGITTAYVTYMNGCVQWNIHPKTNKDGKVPDSLYFDEQQLELVDNGIAKDNKKEIPPTGGAPSKVRSSL
jgi:hypothetical protein